MSFFDETDEPRTAEQAASRGRRPARPGRRPPSDRQAIQVRRAVAAAVLLVVVILIILGVHSCQVSQRNSALKDYNNSVASLMQSSDQTGANLFRTLGSGTSAGGGINLQNSVNESLSSAQSELAHGRGLSVPDEMRAAQQNLVLALEMRRDGIRSIAGQVQQALSKTTSGDAVNAIAAQMARFYASDVVYKDYSAPEIAGALNSAFGSGLGGETIYSGQFLPSLSWLTPSYVAQKLGASASSPTSGHIAPGLHGHALNSVSVAGTQLTSAGNTVTASPPPTFTLSFTNTGNNTETNVVAKVSLQGAGVSGQTTIPQTTAGQTLTANVQLASAPPKGNYTVVATIQPVPGEKNSSNNTLSFPVTFQ